MPEESQNFPLISRRLSARLAFHSIAFASVADEEEALADPAASANAREWDVIRMGRVRSTFPEIQTDSLSARPRASHL